MREILFRGKAFNGEWEYGVPVFSGLNNELAFMKQMHSYDHQVIPETVGQYIGLTDKNGEKIFEGDIVKYKNNLPCKIAYIDCKFVMMWDKFYRDFEQVYDDEIEVIGNIHDNPELLEV